MNDGFHVMGQPRHRITDGLQALVGLVPDWTEHALCAQVDSDAWFPESGGPTAAAKHICAKCPVRSQCLDYALENHERFGIWGGLTVAERQRLGRGDAA